MANEQNLIPISSRSPREITEMARKGGQVRSVGKKWAARLRVLRKKGLTDEEYKKVLAIMEEPESSILDIFNYVQSIKEHCKNATQMTLVADALIKLHKAHHGEKIKSENIHHVVNWNDVMKEILEKDDETNTQKSDQKIV